MHRYREIAIGLLLFVAVGPSRAQEISDLQVIAYADSARISFVTDSLTQSLVDFGLTLSYGSQVSSDDTVTTHSHLLTTLLPQSVYYFRVIATDTLGGADTLSGQYTTPEVPQISNIESVGFAAKADISFDTNVPATAVINYGTTMAFGSQVQSTDTLLSHTIQIAGLSSTTQYFYEIVASDTLGQTVAVDASVTTTSVPVISNLAIPDTTQNSVTITFNTDVRAFSYVQVRDSTDNPGQWRLFTATDSVLTTSHTIVVDTLEDITSNVSNKTNYIPVSDGKYQYRVIAIDSVGNKRTGAAQTFVTKPFGGALPDEWKQRSIGETYLDGRATYDTTSQAFSVIGQGSQLFNEVDDFFMVYQEIEGDFVLKARMHWTAGHLSNLAKAGTHFRVDTTGGSAMVNHSYNYRYADYLYYRRAPDVHHSEIATNELQAYDGQVIWARLTRSGNDFTSEYSFDGQNWSFHGPSSGTNISIARAGMLGLISISKTTRYLEIHYDSVSVTLPDDVTPPVVSEIVATPINNTGQISYESNEWITSIIDYGLDTSYGDSVYVDTVHVENLVTLSGLLFSTEYHYRIRAFDADSNEFVSSDRTFITEDQNPLAVELANFTGVANNGDILLGWMLESTTDIARFDVQRKLDETFETLGSVESDAGTGGRYGYPAHGLPYGIHTFRLRIVGVDGSVSYSRELEVSLDLASAFELTAAYPNPFHTTAAFALTVRESQPVKIELYNAAGQLVRVLHDGVLEGNSRHDFAIDGSGLSGGLYFYRVHGREFNDAGKIVLMK